MKLKIKQNILMEHLNYVIKGVSSKNLIPILNCIKFELEKDGLYLMSTDNDIAIKTFIKASDIEEIDTCGEMVVSGKYIYDIVRKLPSTIINIEEVVDSKVFIYTDTSSFNLNCNIASEFPNLSLEGTKTPITLSKHVFKSIIDQTAFASSTQESKPFLTGINFKITGDTLECTATDSYRLAKKVVTLNETLENSVNIIIPTKNLLELTKLLTMDDENIELHIFNNKIIFMFNNIVMQSSLINGTYPDVSKLIPTEFALTMTTNLQQFYNAIDRASLLTNEADKNTIKFESTEDKVVISSTIPEIGKVEEKLDVKKSNENNIKIAFSSKYMLDAIRSLDSEEIELLFNGEVKPIIVKSPENESLIQLILPIRTY